MASNGPGELWQAYTEDAKPIIGVGLTKPEAAVGGLHAAAHVWVWRKKDKKVEVLLQLRSANTRTWPGFWDISAAGHIDLGETPAQAACREASEEIALEVTEKELELIYTHRTNQKVPNSEIIENEFQFLYLLERDEAMKFVFDDGEVKAVSWHTNDEFKEIIQGKTNKNIVPHGDDYFDKLITSLEAKNT